MAIYYLNGAPQIRVGDRDRNIENYACVRGTGYKVINWTELTEVHRSGVFDKFRFDSTITFTSTLRGRRLNVTRLRWAVKNVNGYFRDPSLFLFGV